MIRTMPKTPASHVSHLHEQAHRVSLLADVPEHRPASPSPRDNAPR
jgi:hypothetical protein